MVATTVYTPVAGGVYTRRASWFPPPSSLATTFPDWSLMMRYTSGPSSPVRVTVYARPAVNRRGLALAVVFPPAALGFGLVGRGQSVRDGKPRGRPRLGGWRLRRGGLPLRLGGRDEPSLEGLGDDLEEGPPGVPPLELAVRPLGGSLPHPAVVRRSVRPRGP